jgi:hypothetical protein
MAEVYVVSMVMPQEPEAEDSGSDNIEALFGGSGDIDMSAATDEHAALVASFEIAHREVETR